MASLRRSQILGGLTALALILAGLGAASSAAAESDSAPGRADKAAAGERHCAVDVKTGTTECFGTFREAVEHATAGRVTDANLSAQTAAADSKTTAKLNSGESGVAAAVVIGIEYYWENYNLNPDGTLHQPAYTLTYSGDVACTTPTSDLDYRAAPLLNDSGVTVNWNNNIRSSSPSTTATSDCGTTRTGPHRTAAGLLAVLGRSGCCPRPGRVHRLVMIMTR